MNIVCFITVDKNDQIEDITWPRWDIEILSSSDGSIFHEWAKHEKIKLASPSDRVMFCLFYRYWWNFHIKHNCSFSKQQNIAIKAVILKTFVNKGDKMLQIIFTQSYDLGNLPEEWKAVVISPIHKKDNIEVLAQKLLTNFPDLYCL